MQAESRNKVGRMSDQCGKDAGAMTAVTRLEKLRGMMKQEGIDAWIVPTDDYHGSEYVAEYFQDRARLTGFTGSAGTALVTMDGAYLWTDGRYFLQAQLELKDSGISLMKMGEEGVPSLADFLSRHMKAGQTVGYDGRCFAAGRASLLTKKLDACGTVCRSSRENGPWNLVKEALGESPALECHPVWELDEAIAGESRSEKISRVREAMKQNGCTYHLLTSLDDIAWLLNLRGSDIAYNPVFCS